MQASSSYLSEPPTSSISDDHPPSYLLPYATLQPTYHQVYAEILAAKLAAEKVWLSIYADNAPMKSIHATIVLSAKENDNVDQPNEVTMQVTKGSPNLLVKEDQVRARRDATLFPVPDLYIATSSSSLTATSPTVAQNSPSITSHLRLRLPIHTTSRLLKGRRSQRAIDSGGGGQISAFDVSPDGIRIVAGGEDGECIVAGLPLWVRGETKNKNDACKVGVGVIQPSIEESIEEKAQRRIQQREKEQLASLRLSLQGHVGDIQSAIFLPSSLVILSASSDLTVRLYSAQDGLCPRIFRGHKRAVTSTASLGRGKRFVSASLDGTIRVWDVKTGKSIRMIGCRGWSGVESLRVVRVGVDSPAQVDEDLGDYLLFAGLSSGYLQVFLLRIKPDDTQAPPTQDDADMTLEAALSNEAVSITDWPLAETAPRPWPTSEAEPGASDFWKLEASTGPLWALDAIRVGTSSSDPAGHWTLNLITGSKTGILRLFQLELKPTEAIVSKAQAGEDVTSDPAAPFSLSSRELLNLKRNSASVHSVRFLPWSSSTRRLCSTAEDVLPPDVVVATADGTPFRLSFVTISSASPTSESSSLHHIEPVVKEEYTGWEAGEPVHGIAVVRAGEQDEEKILLAGAEGVVRIY